jgi:hypothetical protein
LDDFGGLTGRHQGDVVVVVAHLAQHAVQSLASA